MGLTAGLAAAAAGLFVAVFLLDGWSRPGYDPVRQPVSALALGGRGWIQTTSFVVCGAAIAAGGLVVTGATWPLGVAVTVVGLALVASGVFPMDPMRGYPPGTPDTTPASFSRRHRWHDHAGAVVFVGMPVTAAVAALTPGLGWGLRGYSAATALLTVVLGGRFATAWEEDSPRAGVWQRATLVLGLGWLAVLLATVAGTVG